jgi:hypothetical protein
VAYKVTVQVSGQAELLSYLGSIADKLRSPDLNHSVNYVATYWGSSFRSEGSAIGGWADLAQRTVDDREAQGYNGSNPILYRYGSLYQTSTQFFARAKGSGSMSMDTPYDSRGITTTARLELSPGMAHLSLDGPKTSLQFAGIRTRRAPRPFWFVIPAVTMEARKGLERWIVEDVILGSHG